MNKNHDFTWQNFFKRSLILIPIALLGFVIFPLIGGPPLYALFGIYGPTAGITRALRAILVLDFRASLAYHPLAVPITLVFAFSLYHDLLPISKKVANLIFISTGVTVFIFHIFRTYTNPY